MCELILLHKVKLRIDKMYIARYNILVIYRVSVQVWFFTSNERGLDI